MKEVLNSVCVSYLLSFISVKIGVVNFMQQRFFPRNLEGYGMSSNFSQATAAAVSLVLWHMERQERH